MRRLPAPAQDPAHHLPVNTPSSQLPACLPPLIAHRFRPRVTLAASFHLHRFTCDTCCVKLISTISKREGVYPMPAPLKPSNEKRIHIPYASTAGNLPFSGAVVVGNTAYLSGHIGFTPGTRTVPTDLDAEIHAMMASLRDTLTRTMLTMNDLVFVQVFCCDVSLFDQFNAIYTTYFQYPLPARAFIGSG